MEDLINSNILSKEILYIGKQMCCLCHPSSAVGRTLAADGKEIKEEIGVELVQQLDRPVAFQNCFSWTLQVRTGVTWVSSKITNLIVLSTGNENWITTIGASPVLINCPEFAKIAGLGCAVGQEGNIENLIIITYTATSILSWRDISA